MTHFSARLICPPRLYGWCRCGLWSIRRCWFGRNRVGVTMMGGFHDFIQSLAPLTSLVPTRNEHLYLNLSGSHGVSTIRPSFSLSISGEHPEICVFVRNTEEHTILPSGHAHVPFLLWKLTCRTSVVFCRTSHWLAIWTASWQLDSASRKRHADSLSC